MCGICGDLSFNANHAFTGDLTPYIQLMHRRGPDHQAQWHDEAYCGLGFARLSIQDPSPAANQPMLDPEGRFALVFNGELYNFQSLRNQLIKLGYKFRSHGDSEVVLYALAKWGTDALIRFNGMFALGFYDKQKKTLLLARDHAGIKPLYYLKTAEGLFFASQYDQILRHPASRKLPISSDGASLYLRLGYIPAPWAILEQTHMLPAGHWMKIDLDGKVTEDRFFSFPSRYETRLKGDTAIETLDQALTKAVERHLVSDVPVGTFLSGGIDSPLITAKVKQLQGDSITAYTIGTGKDATDESEDAAIYARQIGIPHVIRHISPDESLAMLDEVVSACGEPFGDFSIFPTMLVSRLAREEVTVMLSGDGGDELFWGYAKRFAPVIRQASTFSVPLPVRKIRWGIKKFSGIGNAFPQSTWPTLGDWYRSKQTLLHETQLHRIFTNPPPWPESCRLFSFSGHTADETAQWTRWNEFTGRMNMILLKVDRASMHHALEVRTPLLDREVVDIAARIDWRTCLDPKKEIGKLPLRNLLQRHVNHQTQAKRGFTVPMHRWLKGPLREVFMETVLKRDELTGIPLNKAGLKQVHGEFEQGADYAWGLWLLLSLALWEDRHFNPNRWGA